MGLDITAYSNLKHIGFHEKDPELNEGEPGELYDHCYYEYHIDAYAYDDFPQSFRGIPILRRGESGGGWGGRASFLYGGCFQWTEGTQRHDFRAGSYGGYNQWRDDLKAQFNPDLDPEKPFYELIWFADNEGSIGPEACIDLWEDFIANREAYYSVGNGDPTDLYDKELYEHWTKAFEFGTYDGLVRFH